MTDPPSSSEQLALDDPKLKSLDGLIRKSFRVRANKTPVYVDVAGHLDRIKLDQHQIVFGRRGSGKSCLLIYFRREAAPAANIHTVYILGDTIKTLEYPDVLLRLLLAVFEGLPSATRRRRFARWLSRKSSEVDDVIGELRELLGRSATSHLKQTQGASSEDSRRRRFTLKGKRGELGRERERARKQSDETVRESDEEKVRIIDGRLGDYKRIIDTELETAACEYGAFIIDDFYLINPEFQPDVIDYLHRLLRDTDLYLKVGTVRHRSRLLRTTPIHVGIQPQQDVDGFSLDQTLEDLSQTSAYLEEMLRKLGEQVGIDDALEVLSADGRSDLVLLSGGVPRDYLTIFVGGLERARRRKNAARVTPTDLRQAAAALNQETKLRDLRTDAGSEVPALEALFVDLVDFCLKEKLKTAFLLSKDEIAAYPEAHELVQQLMDFKLIHLVEPSTSAASGRPGRFEAYTLDAALFLEPRRRYIEIVRFWETDDQRRRVKLREAPVYELSRARRVINGDLNVKAEHGLDIAASIESDPSGEPLVLFDGGS